MAVFKDLIVYQKAFSLAMEIYQISKDFPAEERYGLTSQIRRSSRSVCSNLAEGYRKRRYPKHFIAKLTDADMENTETLVWCDFILACNFISQEKYEQLISMNSEIGRILGGMMAHPEKFK